MSDILSIQSVRVKAREPKSRTGVRAFLVLSRAEKWVLPAIVSTVLLLGTNAVSPVAANWIAIVLFLLGVPHGAIERTHHAVRFQMPTLAYCALYIVFGILVFASWLISPLGTFVLFLMLSAWHFGQSEPAIKLLGGWVIIGSCLFYPAETLSVFGQLTLADLSSQTLLTASRFAAGGVLILLLCEYALKGRGEKRMSAFRLIFLVGVFIALPPIQAVAIYFFAFHGVGEFARTLGAVSRSGSEVTLTSVLKLYGPATFPAMIGAIAIIVFVLQGAVPLILAAGLGVAFIIPHMLPIEGLLRLDRE